MFSFAGTNPKSILGLLGRTASLSWCMSGEVAASQTVTGGRCSLRRFTFNTSGIFCKFRFYLFFKGLLRFGKDAFEVLAEALDIPESLVFGEGYRTNR